MTKLWKVLCVAVVAAGLSAPTEAQAQFDICDFLPFLPQCQPQECSCGDELDALQGQIDGLTATVAGQATAIAELEDCCDTNTAAIDALETTVGDIIAAIGPCEGFEGDGAYMECVDGECTNTDTDEANCGDCGIVCDANETCEGGICTLIVCPVVECQDATLNEDGSCTYTNQAAGTACDDGKDCTGTVLDPDECDGAGICVGGAFPCADGETCVEGSGSPPTCNPAP